MTPLKGVTYYSQVMAASLLRGEKKVRFLVLGGSIDSLGTFPMVATFIMEILGWVILWTITVFCIY